ncbi:MAG: isoprenyl transferase [Deltaproteobacteria bacterium]|nr:isoprenyl transferase [Deltaproteobacteria bacterium]
MTELEKDNIPRHIAIIMDGNGRWARKRLLNRINGHRKGMDAVKEVVTAAREIGVKYLTLYAFSTENWKRPPEEIKALMTLLGKYLKSELPMMMDNGIRLVTVGKIEDIPDKERGVLQDTIAKTSGNKGMVLNLALSYGGRDEILYSCRLLAEKVKTGDLAPQHITENLFTENLLTAGIPDPDLLIRTSGEMRLSNFLLWQSAYTELYFSDTLWPDFGEADLLLAIKDYQSRERRFGKTSDQVTPEVKPN